MVRTVSFGAAADPKNPDKVVFFPVPPSARVLLNPCDSGTPALRLQWSVARGWHMVYPPRPHRIEETIGSKRRRRRVVVRTKLMSAVQTWPTGRSCWLELRKRVGDTIAKRAMDLVQTEAVGIAADEDARLLAEGVAASKWQTQPVTVQPSVCGFQWGLGQTGWRTEPLPESDDETLPDGVLPSDLLDLEAEFASFAA